MPSLAELAWPQVGERARAGAVLAIPLGSTEQHGPHLPLSTDSDIAAALCARLDGSRTDVLVAPAVAYGSSGEHAGFAGTLSIGQHALELLVLELGRSAFDTFAHVIFVSAHGGNAEPVARAAAQLRAEGRDVLVLMPRWDGEPHAGRAETSMLLTLRPRTVQVDLMEPGDTRPMAQLLPLLKARGLRAVTGNGILGDPTGASADEGEALLDRLTGDLNTAVTQWRGHT
jgi:mycofactocin precursor peptide peptidase